MSVVVIVRLLGVRRLRGVILLPKLSVAATLQYHVPVARPVAVYDLVVM